MVVHVASLIESLYTLIDRFDTSSRMDECVWHTHTHDSLLWIPDILHEPRGAERLPDTQEILSPRELLQELLYLIWLVSSGKDTSTDLWQRDESSRDIG